MAATVRKKDRKAPVVQFIADVSTAVITVESAKQKITGTGVETTKLTATVMDVNNNPISNYSLKWKTSLGTVTAGKDPTDRKGRATATLKAPLFESPKETSNGEALVTATGNAKGITVDRDTTVTVRAVLNVGGKRY